MTKLCDNCLYFIPIKVQHSWSNERNQGSDPEESAHSGQVDPLTNPHAVAPPREWDLFVDEYRVGLCSIRLDLVERGSDLGCQLCSLLLRAVGPARISALRTSRGEDGNWIHIRGESPISIPASNWFQYFLGLVAPHLGTMKSFETHRANVSHPERRH